MVVFYRRVFPEEISRGGAEARSFYMSGFLCVSAGSLGSFGSDFGGHAGVERRAFEALGVVFEAATEVEFFLKRFPAEARRRGVFL
jgi:hypothetical protein